MNDRNIKNFQSPAEAGNTDAAEVRRAQPSDADIIADLSRETFFDTFASQNTEENMNHFMANQFAREKLMEEVSDPMNEFFLAFHQGKVAGYLKLRAHHHEKLPAGASMEIVRIYSATSMIGKGIGKLLMQTAINEASRKGKSHVWLGVWEKNQRAIDFYTKWGFEKFGEHNFILGNDIQKDWLMKKDLTVTPILPKE